MTPKKAKKGCPAGHPGCECTLVCCRISPERAAQIAEEARAAVPGGWALEVSVGPSCTCGMKPEAGHSYVLGVPVERKCQAHG